MTIFSFLESTEQFLTVAYSSVAVELVRSESQMNTDPISFRDLPRSRSENVDAPVDFLPIFCRFPIYRRKSISGPDRRIVRARLKGSFSELNRLRGLGGRGCGMIIGQSDRDCGTPRCTDIRASSPGSPKSHSATDYRLIPLASPPRPRPPAVTLVIAS